MQYDFNQLLISSPLMGVTWVNLQPGFNSGLPAWEADDQPMLISLPLVTMLFTWTDRQHIPIVVVVVVLLILNIGVVIVIIIIIIIIIIIVFVIIIIVLVITVVINNW